MRANSRCRWAASPLLALVLFASLLSGCAVGNRYDYTDADIALRVEGAGPMGLAVVDRRPYVLSGDKNPDFIGLQRGGFGNPFDVSTESGRPLADEIQDALKAALEKRGYEVVELTIPPGGDASTSGAIAMRGITTNLVLELFEWKTDAMMRFGLSYSLRLQVLDSGGTVLATASSTGNKESLGPGGFESQNALLAQRALSEKLEALFNNPDIQGALASG